ncbi:MarR family winged helix-turn-helix transcriptional regulator [Exiguobacterium undae]|uniref:Transcriptional regulator n=1 Tax=Exiguobacterium undae TaxID=169177 RepID=A0ABX2V7J6_9BACL|nr:MarR family transcriptional regulator [Exiguobacterium undae]OAN12850.1 transcriptional regulator [Exiguobacterium undae]
MESTDSKLALKMLVVLSRTMHAVTEQVKVDIKTHQLNLSEFGVLELLYHKGDTPLQQIGDKILLTSGSVTYVVDKLENRGLLARRSCPTDRRVTFGTLTEAGRTLMEETFPKHEAFLTDLFSDLSIEEKEQLIDQLKRIGHKADHYTHAKKA